MTTSLDEAVQLAREYIACDEWCDRVRAAGVVDTDAPRLSEDFEVGGMTLARAVLELHADRDRLRDALREALDSFEANASLLSDGIAWEANRRIAALRKEFDL
jgi:hypothetical protein